MDLTAHGGDIYTLARELGRAPEEILDFSANTNPWGTPPQVKEAIKRAAEFCCPYPDPACRALCQAIGEKEGIPPQAVLCGNGAADLIFRLVWALRPRIGLVLAPTFSEYEKALRSVGAAVQYIGLSREEDFALAGSNLEVPLDGVELAFLCNPNNPTGQCTTRRELQPFLERCRRLGLPVLVDECFQDFLKDGAGFTLVPLLEEFPNLVVLKAFTKMYGMAGVRLGYCLCSDPSLLDKMAAAGQHWGVSTLAQEAGLAALSLEGYAQRTAGYVAAEREILCQGLERLGLRVVPSRANYLLFHSHVPDLDRRLRPHGILLRSCANYRGLGPGDYRSAVKDREKNGALLAALQKVLL